MILRLRLLLVLNISARGDYYVAVTRTMYPSLFINRPYSSRAARDVMAVIACTTHVPNIACSLLSEFCDSLFLLLIGRSKGRYALA